MCNLIWCYVDMLVCFAWIVTHLLDQRPRFLAVVRHISVLNQSLPHFPLFHCLSLCEFISCRDGVCGEGVLFVQLDVFIVLLCQVCGESRDIVLSASPWNVGVTAGASTSRPWESDISDCKSCYHHPPRARTPNKYHTSARQPLRYIIYNTCYY